MLPADLHEKCEQLRKHHLEFIRWLRRAQYVWVIMASISAGLIISAAWTLLFMDGGRLSWVALIWNCGNLAVAVYMSKRCIKKDLPEAKQAWRSCEWRLRAMGWNPNEEESDA